MTSILRIDARDQVRNAWYFRSRGNTMSATAFAQSGNSPPTTVIDREALAARVTAVFQGVFARLTDHKADIDNLWTEFSLLRGEETISGCRTKTDFCQKVLGRSIRSVQYLLTGGNPVAKRKPSPKRHETVSLPDPAAAPAPTPSPAPTGWSSLDDPPAAPAQAPAAAVAPAQATTPVFAFVSAKEHLTGFIDVFVEYAESDWERFEGGWSCPNDVLCESRFFFIGEDYDSGGKTTCKKNRRQHYTALRAALRQRLLKAQMLTPAVEAALTRWSTDCDLPAEAIPVAPASAPAARTPVDGETMYSIRFAAPVHKFKKLTDQKIAEIFRLDDVLKTLTRTDVNPPRVFLFNDPAKSDMFEIIDGTHTPLSPVDARTIRNLRCNLLKSVKPSPSKKS
jgi:hypothetical protein